MLMQRESLWIDLLSNRLNSKILAAFNGWSMAIMGVSDSKTWVCNLGGMSSIRLSTLKNRSTNWSAKFSSPSIMSESDHSLGTILTEMARLCIPLIYDPTLISIIVSIFTSLSPFSFLVSKSKFMVVWMLCTCLTCLGPTNLDELKFLTLSDYQAAQLTEGTKDSDDNYCLIFLQTEDEPVKVVLIDIESDGQ